MPYRVFSRPYTSAGRSAAGQRALDRFEDLLDHFAAVAARRLDRFRQRPVAHRIQVRERQVLQLAVDVVQAQPVRDRHVHFHRLGGDAALLGRRHVLERAHVVQAVGQLDQDDAHVRRHRQQHLAEVFRLRFDQALEFDFFELGQAVDEGGDRRAEAFDQLFLLDVLVFHHVVQQRGHDGLGVKLPVGADFGDRDRMDNVGFARLADLAEMHLVGKTICFLDLFQFGRGEVFGQLGGQLGDRGDRRRGGRRGVVLRLGRRARGPGLGRA